MHANRRSRGFSLIELLIVMVIIAILVLIAIPAISQYRSNARIAAVQSDLRNAATSLESRFITDGAYPTAGTTSTAASPTFSRPSAGVTLTVTAATGDFVCVDGVHAGVGGNASKFYYASGDASPVERGVHAGTCAGGTGAYTAPAVVGAVNSDGTINLPGGTTATAVSSSNASPGAIRSVTKNANGRTTITWNPTTGPNNAAVGIYNFQISTDGGQTWNTSYANSGCTLSGGVCSYGNFDPLPTGTIAFRLEALNSVGASFSPPVITPVYGVKIA